jgi:hypothetical protein
MRHLRLAVGAGFAAIAVLAASPAAAEGATPGSDACVRTQSREGAPREASRAGSGNRTASRGAKGCGVEAAPNPPADFLFVQRVG